MMFEYAACYGGPPAPGMAWRLFLAGYKRTSMFGARAKLSTLEAVGAAVAAAFGDKTVDVLRKSLVAEAYPLKRRPIVFHPNMFAPGYMEPANG